MLAVSCAALALMCSVSAAPMEKRDLFSSYGFPFVVAMVKPSSYGSVATSSAVGGGMPSFYMPNPYMFNPFMINPFTPDFYSRMVPWYEGPNVCVTTKEMDEPDEMKEWLSEDFDGTFSQESTSCRGNNEKHVCVERKTKNDGTKMQMKKWECCYGFVRTTDGTPGCTESGSEDEKSVTPATSIKQMKVKDQFKYSYYSKDNPKDKSGVENVPVQ